MKRVLGAFLVAAALGATGCGKEETTKYCAEACDIWASCDWDRATCMSECQSAKDWDKAYLDCLKAQPTCQTLDSCG